MGQSETISAETTLRLTKSQTKAAFLCAEDKKSDGKIAGELGIARATLSRWKLLPQFEAEVERVRKAFRAAIMKRGIARMERRIESLDEDFEATEIIRRARAADQGGRMVAAGGASGFIVRRNHVIQNGAGLKPIVLEEFAFDGSLMAERRAIRKHVAQEVGDWIEKGSLAMDLTPALARMMYADLNKEPANDDADEEPIR